MPLRIAFFGQVPSVATPWCVCWRRATTSQPSTRRRRARGRTPLATEAASRGLRLLRHARFRAKGAAILELVAEHRALRADLNVLAFVTVILPPEIVDSPPQGSLCFHPSLLPRFRGGTRWRGRS